VHSFWRGGGAAGTHGPSDDATVLVSAPAKELPSLTPRVGLVHEALYLFRFMLILPTWAAAVRVLCVLLAA